ncbi:reverse transcriptase domain-containing protein [Pimelobacter sp. 30-1]|uniref:reverse transcriptase domain-containing protein n=1 Tax=Pimelobacter sp. 30-1 TaxID=2004991 RepID=UPI001C059815|nr:reverse transcriptase domain-containing protein [Pimelobacter sp. 30-1]MBU2694170.1 hypothetical protein [Pimelobacter sp. 30-1]
MWGGLEEAIYNAATRQVAKHEAYFRWVYEENRRRARRSTAAAAKVQIRRPRVWTLDPGFDPYLVRARSATIAHSMTRALKRGVYTPHRPAGRLVEKRSGGYRTVSMFPIADEVISNRVYSSLMDKNRPLLSSRSYAYRRDLSPHDAILHMRAEFQQSARLFVAEYDFSKFFDKISHQHIWTCIDSLNIVRTPREEALVEAFLATPEPYLDATAKASHATSRTIGLPQGTSLSLFLANLAASPLDRALERLGVNFVRYADDTVIWSSSYDAVCEAASALHELSETIGSPINSDKSPGVRLLRNGVSAPHEMKSTAFVEYLGHAVELRSIRMHDDAVRRIKAKVNQLIFTNLLLEPLRGTQDTSRIGKNDRDYVVYVWQLRRYLYGSLSEAQVRRFQNGQVPPMSFKGAMSFYPLVNDAEKLADLDAWITTHTWLALQKRRKLLAAAGVASSPVVWQVRREKLHSFSTTATATGALIDLRLPSVCRISSLIQDAVKRHGIAVVAGGGALYNY